CGSGGGCSASIWDRSGCCPRCGSSARSVPCGGEPCGSRLIFGWARSFGAEFAGFPVPAYSGLTGGWNGPPRYGPSAEVAATLAFSLGRTIDAEIAGLLEAARRGDASAQTSL